MGLPKMHEGDNFCRKDKTEDGVALAIKVPHCAPSMRCDNSLARSIAREAVRKLSTWRPRTMTQWTVTTLRTSFLVRVLIREMRFPRKAWDRTDCNLARDPRHLALIGPHFGIDRPR